MRGFLVVGFASILRGTASQRFRMSLLLLENAMGKTYEHIDDRVEAFIRAQKVFFVGSAPLQGDGHVNLSPKGYDSFAILGPNRVAFCDLGGSGIETVAHVRENQRLTIMFCAFEGAANILRLYGKAQIIQFDDPDFAKALDWFPAHDRARNIITMDVTRIQDSCGWGVPFYEFKGERDQLKRAQAGRSVEEAGERFYTRNATSIDGLPGIIRKPNE